MKAVEIGTIGEAKIYMRLDELVRIANRELQDFADDVCKDNSKLRYKLDTAVESLEVILDEAQKDEPCIQAIRAVAYTALKGD